MTPSVSATTCRSGACCVLCAVCCVLTLAVAALEYMPCVMLGAPPLVVCARARAVHAYLHLGLVAVLQFRTIPVGVNVGLCVRPPALMCTRLRRPAGSTIAIAPTDDVHDIFSVPPESALAIRVGAQVFR
jgi:hypothetical protein